MEIRKTKPEELEVLLKMYEHARRFMATHGNASQWENNYPSPQLILDDITEGNSYVCTEKDQIVPTFYYKEGADPTYMRIYEGEWINDSRYGVVHRITSTGNVKGAASFCLNWALEQCGNIRIDTHRDNIVMQHLCTGIQHHAAVCTQFAKISRKNRRTYDRHILSLRSVIL